MTMDELAELIGEDADSARVRSLVASESLAASADPDLEEGEIPRRYLTNRRDGYLLTNQGGRIVTLHLLVVPKDLEAAEGYQPFRGALTAGLTAESTRAEVLRQFGPPARSGEAVNHRLFGRLGAWDRFDGERVCLHFEYAGPDDRIGQITVMAAGTAP